MVRFATLGCYDVCNNDPTVTLSVDVKNNSIYNNKLIHNEIHGDTAYCENTIKAGELIRAFDLENVIGGTLIITKADIASLPTEGEITGYVTNSGATLTYAASATGLAYKVVEVFATELKVQVVKA